MTTASQRPWRNPEFEADLRRMLRLVRADAGREPLPTEPYMQTLAGTSLLFQGETLTLLRSLERRLAGSTQQGGVSIKEAESLLMAAGSRAVEGSYADAEAWLIREVETPLDDWLVVDQVEHIYLPVRRLDVGRSIFYLERPRRLKRKNAAEMLAIHEFEPPFVVTTVTARDARAAHAIASERFAESGAILDLIDRPKADGSSFYAIRRDERGTLSVDRGGWILSDFWVGENGRLIPPYLQLSRGANKEEAQRSDWERRVLAASRWFSRSLRSPWPADRLVSLMVALESLFVEGQKIQNKGQTIAKAVTERFLRRGMTSTDQEAWLGGLYLRRNDSVHEGREYQADLEVELLADITHVAIRWAAHHLVPAHRASGRSCRTFAAAMRCTD